MPAEGLLLVAFEDDVLPDLHIPDHAFFKAILGNSRNAKPNHIPGGLNTQELPFEQNSAFRDQAGACKNARQNPLTISGDAGDADDLAMSNVEIYVP